MDNPLVAYLTYTLPIIIIIFIGFALNTTLQQGILFNFYTIVALILLPILMVSAVLFNSQVFFPKFVLFLIFSTFVVALSMLLIVMYNYLSAYSFTLQNVVIRLIYITIFVFGLAIALSIALFFLPQLSNIVSLPKKTVDFLRFLRDEWVLTKPLFIVLLIVEILLVFAFFFVPWVLTQNPMPFSSLNFNGVKILQDQPYFLNKRQEKVLATSRDLEVVDPQFAANPYLKIYTISMRVYINPKESYTDEKHEMNLLFYGTKQLDRHNEWELVNPKPAMTYSYDTKTKKDVYKIYVGQGPPHLINIPNQKWNQFVFIFNGSSADVFVNGILEKTIQYPMSTMTFTANDLILIGDDSEQLYGVISDVIYYDYAMTEAQVVSSWNMQKHNIDVKVA
jgi:hypothetical protein